MSANPKTLEYLQRGLTNLIEHGSFRNGKHFRPTQGDALLAYHNFLFGNELSSEEKLRGFFELATGTGKTALFLSIINEAHAVARGEGDTLQAMIVVPTIPLLKQTYKAVNQWAPDYKGSVGRYGDSHKELDKELTIITYDSWSALMERGEIDSSNVDILVSDEAHRGTSARRITNIFNAFSRGTVRLAFTATARFDEEKSVEQTHEHEIFARSLPESVRLDELSSYIQTQLYEIGVQPPERKDEFIGAATAHYTSLRAGMKQEAWMAQMVPVFREGRDEHTGDLLSDNKAGFYVGDIAMANKMADLLNADPVLQSRATVRKKKAVAIAIHSRMPPKEQEARLKAFLRGKYMACVSDGKIKEGYDDPAMKTIFDYTRGSLVDKAQIIGRGARKWWNPIKQRDEGMTFIDTVVFIGAKNPEENEKLREEAYRDAVLAWDVLEGTAVLSPRREPTDKAYPSSAAGIPVLPGLIVRSYASLEDVKAIYAKQQALIEDNEIVITNDIRQSLIDEKNRVGFSTAELFRRAKNVPKKLSQYMVTAWINGIILTAKKDHLDWLYDKYKEFPTDRIIDITSEMHESLIKERTRTMVGSIALLKKYSSVPEGLTNRKIETWVNKNTSTVKTSEWEWVLNSYCSLSNADNIISITDERHTELIRERERTNLGPIDLLKNVSNIPDGLNVNMVQSWIQKKVIGAEEKRWNWVVDKYKAAPTVLKITDEMLAELKAERARTNISPEELVEIALNVPKKMNSGRIRSFFNGVKTILESEWMWLISSYKDLPASEHMLLTREMRLNLKNIVSTLRGKEAAAIVIIKEAELNVSIKSFKAWCDNESSVSKVLRKDWNAVISVLSLNEKIPLTQDMRLDLRENMRKASIGSVALAQKIKNCETVTESKIKAWTSLNNATRWVVKTEWEAATGTVRALLKEVILLPEPTTPAPS